MNCFFVVENDLNMYLITKHGDHCHYVQLAEHPVSQANPTPEHGVYGSLCSSAAQGEPTWPVCTFALLFPEWLLTPMPELTAQLLSVMVGGGGFPDNAGSLVFIMSGSFFMLTTFSVSQ